MSFWSEDEDCLLLYARESEENTISELSLKLGRTKGAIWQRYAKIIKSLAEGDRKAKIEKGAILWPKIKRCVLLTLLYVAVDLC